MATGRDKVATGRDKKEGRAGARPSQGGHTMSGTAKAGPPASATDEKVMNTHSLPRM